MIPILFLAIFRLTIYKISSYMGYFRKRFKAFVIISIVVSAIGLVGNICNGEFDSDAVLGSLLVGLGVAVFCLFLYVTGVDMRGRPFDHDIPPGERDMILNQARGEGARRARSVVNTTTTQVCSVCLGRGKNAAGYVCPVCNGSGQTSTKK